MHALARARSEPEMKRPPLIALRLPLLLALSAALLLVPLAHAQTTSLAICGNVETYVPARIFAAGLLVIDGKSIVIASRSQISGEALLTAGASVCVTGSLLDGELVNAEVRANARTSLALCGRVQSFTAATMNSAGFLTIDSRRIAIAAGTSIANADLLKVGAD